MKRVNVWVEFSHTTIPLVPRCVRILCHCPLSWKSELIYPRDYNLMTTYSYVCMNIVLTPRRDASFFERLSPFYIQYNLSVPLYQPLSTGSGSILGAVACRVSPGIGIGWTAIVVVQTPYIWSHLASMSCFTGETSVSGIEPETCSQSFGHHTKALVLFFGPTVLGGFRTTRSQKNT